MNVHRNPKKYLLLMLIALVFSAGMAFGECPCKAENRASQMPMHQRYRRAYLHQQACCQQSLQLIIHQVSRICRPAPIPEKSEERIDIQRLLPIRMEIS